MIVDEGAQAVKEEADDHQHGYVLDPCHLEDLGNLRGVGDRGDGDADDGSGVEYGDTDVVIGG